MTQDVYMNRGGVHAEVADVLDRAAGISDEYRQLTFTVKAEIASDVARAGIEPATFRFSDGVALGWKLFALVKLDTRSAFRRVGSVGPARWPHLGPMK
jgi:hypothetical protein